LLAKKIVRRESLYSDFISESARLLVDASEHNTTDPRNLILSYALLSRIRLSSSQDVLVAPEEVVKGIIGTYAKTEPDGGANPVRRHEQRRSTEKLQ
jgi:hypothetical protein